MNILVIGDSIIKYMEMYLVNGLKRHKIIFKPLPGIRIEGLTEKISSYKCPLDYILVHVGTYNVLSDGVGLILDKFGHLFEKI